MIHRSRLKPPTLEQVIAWDRKPRKPLPRATKPIAKIGRKGRRERKAIAAFAAAVRAQAQGFCEAQVYGVCSAQIHQGTMAHHVWPEDRDCGRHEPGRGAWLCWFAHRWVHENPDDARDIGLLRPDPA